MDLRLAKLGMMVFSNYVNTITLHIYIFGRGGGKIIRLCNMGRVNRPAGRYWQVTQKCFKICLFPPCY